MSFLDRIEEANRVTPARYRPLRVAGDTVGALTDEFAEHLSAWPDVFNVSADAVTLTPVLEARGAFRARTEALARLTEALHREGVIGGWRDELFVVARRWGEDPLMLLERASVTHFGVRTWSVHVNGYVRDGDDLHVWVAERSADKPTHPGELDQMVAGGQPHGLGLHENVVKECAEEAGIPAELASGARPVGAIRYQRDEPRGLKRDTVFVFDLELPPDFRPVNQDGEVARFDLWPVADLADAVRDTTAFKFNCALVNIHFLVRHGLIPASHPDYEGIVTGLIR